MIDNIAKKIFGAKTTKLDKELEEKAYMEEKLKQAEKIGKARAEAEAKAEIEEIKAKPKAKSKSGFAKFQDYATNFANNQEKHRSIAGDTGLNIGGMNNERKTKKKSKRSRARNVWG